ncbi:hypothetical protein CP533_3704 [Ophiocordyceps camponoti-saundersi (nom. inval.)]|nr:hypothetical protein CP533_3704 [Ophiocordyceps camponoti-saundersi (nom. inval.)]
MAKACAFNNEDAPHAGKDRILEACRKSGLTIKKNTFESFHCRACQLRKADAVISRDPAILPTSFLQYVLFTKTRDKAFKRLKAWKRSVNATAGGCRIQAANEGFILRFCAPYTPAQNGRAERAGRTLIEATRAICIETKLPEKLWPFFIDSSAYMQNMLPSSTNPKNQSPIEIVIAAIRVPYKYSIKYIRSIQSAKIAPRAKEGRLVGIEGLHGHIYKIYLPDEDKIIRARDVRFHDPANLDLNQTVKYVAEPEIKEDQED